MPSRRLPNSMPSVIRTLTTARDAWKRFPNDRLISPEHWTKLDDDASKNAFLTRLLKEAGDVPIALAAQAPLTSAFSQVLAKTTLYVSHFHQVFDLGVGRSDFTAGSRAYYDRDVSSTSIPDLSSIDAVIEAAEKIVKGEAARKTAEGTAYRAMDLPSAAEIALLHDDLKAKRTASETAKDKTDREQNELSALYAEAQKLAVSIVNTVEFRLGERDDLDDAGRRRIARLWGVVYVNSDGTATNEDAPAPAPQPQ